MRYSLSLILIALALAGPALALPAADYIWQEEAVANIAPSAERYRTELKNQVLEMINTGDRAVDNGCLQPALYRVGILGSFMLYGSPAETVYVLSDAYPLLDATTQASVKAYLARFMSQYPPLTYRYIHGTQGWGSVTLGRNRREYYPLPAGFAQNVWPQPAVPMEVCYAMWRYADATGDWAYLNTHMSQIQAVYNAYDNTPSRYGEVMGLIGMARIADHFGNTTLRDAAVSKATAAIGASNFDNWLATASTSFNMGVHDWSFPLFHYVRGATTGAYFCPEIGRLIGADQALAGRTTTSVRIGLGVTDHARATYPGWFAYKGDYCYGEYIHKNIAGWEQNSQGGENAYNTPDFSWTFFMLRAYLYGDPAADLARMVDSPTCVGDLFYFQKLAVLIRSHGTRTWADVRGKTAEAIQADVLAPAAVGNLASGGATPDSVTLTWTAPGDDGFAGTAKAYDIRYSTSAITEANWGSAIQASNLPTPKAVGQPESFVVTGLAPGTTYYFGVKTADEVPNWSTLSNVPSKATATVVATTTQAVLPNLATFPVIAGAVNLVTNGGFESGALDGWTASGMFAVNPQTPREGAQAVRHVGAAQGAQCLFQGGIVLTGGATYILKVGYKVDSADRSAKAGPMVEIGVYHSTGPVGANALAKVAINDDAVTDGWQIATLSYTPKVNTTVAVGFLNLGSDAVVGLDAFTLLAEPAARPEKQPKNKPADRQAERHQAPTTAPADTPASVEPASRPSASKPAPAQPAGQEKTQDNSVIALLVGHSASVSTASGTTVVGQATATHAKKVAVTFTLVQQPEHGSVEMQADGAFTYAPDDDYIGEDSFTFWVDDGRQYSDPATVTVTIHSPDDQMSPPIPLDDAWAEESTDYTD